MAKSTRSSGGHAQGRGSQSRSTQGRSSQSRSAQDRNVHYSHTARKGRDSAYESRNSGYGRKAAERAAEEKSEQGFFARIGEMFSEMGHVFRDETLRMDQMMLWIIVILVVVGSLMMFSASYAYAYFNRENDSAFFFKQQLKFALTGLVVMYGVSLLPVRYLKHMTIWLMLLSTVLLGAVYLFDPINGARRWMFGFQPSEFSKFVVILFCATWADTHSKQMKTFVWGILPFLLFVGLTAGLVLFEPHISGALIIVLIAATIMVVGGMNLKVFGVLAGAAVAGVVCLAVFREPLSQIGIFERAYGRIDVWLNPFENPQGSGWQTIQALYAISSGGLFGQGIGNSHQKHLYISEPQNDFIFAVICEELGFVGAVAIILLFVIFVWRGYSLSFSNSNRFSMLLGIGITSQVAWQALLNIMVVTNCAPNTGISLPFFSYGGSSLLVLLAEMGILLSISREASIKKV